MAACESLQSVVLLADVVDEDSGEIQQPSQFQLEQTEPLNLCLNGLINEFATLEFSPDEKKNDKGDDDVIFVKEFKSKDKTKLCNGQKVPLEEPRRNPIRKARDIKRFEEYADADFLDDHFSEALEDEGCLDTSDTIVVNNEDSEDWKLENIPKRNRQRRKVVNRKLSRKLGRKRKINAIKEETKVSLQELESLVQTNLLLLKDYISDINTVKKVLRNEEKENCHHFDDATKNAINIFKQQVTLFTAVKEVDVQEAKSTLDLIVS